MLILRLVNVTVLRTLLVAKVAVLLTIVLVTMRVVLEGLSTVESETWLSVVVSVLSYSPSFFVRVVVYGTVTSSVVTEDWRVFEIWTTVLVALASVSFMFMFRLVKVSSVLYKSISVFTTTTSLTSYMTMFYEFYIQNFAYDFGHCNNV